MNARKSEKKVNTATLILNNQKTVERHKRFDGVVRQPLKWLVTVLHEATSSGRQWRNAGLMLDQRRRRWTNINPALVQDLMFDGVHQKAEVILDLGGRSQGRGSLLGYTGVRSLWEMQSALPSGWDHGPPGIVGIYGPRPAQYSARGISSPTGESCRSFAGGRKIVIWAWWAKEVRDRVWESGVCLNCGDEYPWQTRNVGLMLGQRRSLVFFTIFAANVPYDDT